MTLVDAETGRVCGYVRMSSAPYWWDSWYAICDELYKEQRMIVCDSFAGARHELEAYDLERVAPN